MLVLLADIRAFCSLLHTQRPDLRQCGEVPLTILVKTRFLSEMFLLSNFSESRYPLSAGIIFLFYFSASFCAWIEFGCSFAVQTRTYFFWYFCFRVLTLGLCMNRHKLPENTSGREQASTGDLVIQLFLIVVEMYPFSKRSYNFRGVMIAELDSGLNSSQVRWIYSNFCWL